MRLKPHSHRQLGFTLAEVMIAGSIGVVLLLSLSTMMSRQGTDIQVLRMQSTRDSLITHLSAAAGNCTANYNSALWNQTATVPFPGPSNMTDQTLKGCFSGGGANCIGISGGNPRIYPITIIDAANQIVAGPGTADFLSDGSYTNVRPAFPAPMTNPPGNVVSYGANGVPCFDNSTSPPTRIWKATQQCPLVAVAWAVFPDCGVGGCGAGNPATGGAIYYTVLQMAVPSSRFRLKQYEPRHQQINSGFGSALTLTTCAVIPPTTAVGSAPYLTRFGSPNASMLQNSVIQQNGTNIGVYLPTGTNASYPFQINSNTATPIIAMGMNPGGGAGNDQLRISNTTGSAYLYAYSDGNTQAALGAYGGAPAGPQTLLLNPTGGAVEIGRHSGGGMPSSLTIDGIGLFIDSKDSMFRPSIVFRSDSITNSPILQALKDGTLRISGSSGTIGNLYLSGTVGTRLCFGGIGAETECAANLMHLQTNRLSIAANAHDNIGLFENGSVGIGLSTASATPAPSATLHVEGSTFINDPGNSGGNVPHGCYFKTCTGIGLWSCLCDDPDRDLMTDHFGDCSSGKISRFNAALNGHNLPYGISEFRCRDNDPDDMLYLKLLCCRY